MLQNARVTTFTVSELLRENQQGGGIKLPSPLLKHTHTHTHTHTPKKHTHTQTLIRVKSNLSNPLSRIRFDCTKNMYIHENKDSVKLMSNVFSSFLKFVKLLLKYIGVLSTLRYVFRLIMKIKEVQCKQEKRARYTTRPAWQNDRVDSRRCVRRCAEVHEIKHLVMKFMW